MPHDDTDGAVPPADEVGAVTEVRSRTRVALAVPVTIALGLLLRFGPPPEFGDPAGGVLYAVLLYLVVAFIGPGLSGPTVGAISLSACVAIELLQASALPGRLAEVFPPSALVFGTQFSLADLPPYVLGAVVGVLIDRFLRRP